MNVKVHLKVPAGKFLLATKVSSEQYEGLIGVIARGGGTITISTTVVVPVENIAYVEIVE